MQTRTIPRFFDGPSGEIFYETEGVEGQVEIKNWKAVFSISQALASGMGEPQHWLDGAWEDGQLVFNEESPVPKGNITAVLNTSTGESLNKPFFWWDDQWKLGTHSEYK